MNLDSFRLMLYDCFQMDIYYPNWFVSKEFQKASYQNSAVNALYSFVS